jgi:hypothetical protein
MNNKSKTRARRNRLLPANHAKSLNKGNPYVEGAADQSSQITPPEQLLSICQHRL